MKVSFDYDGTLEFPHVQDYAKKLISEGHEVWVVTTWWDENHRHRYLNIPDLNDLWTVVDNLGIPRWKVRFTCMAWKHTYLDGTQFIWHLDDNPDEIKHARMNGCSVPIVHVENPNWKLRCDQLLKRETDPEYDE